MALDNPAYFNVSAGATLPSVGPSSSRSKFALFKRKQAKGMGASSSSSTSSGPDGSLFSVSEGSLFSKQPTPPLNSLPQRRAMRHLLHSASSTSDDFGQELLVLGEPRLSDIAPPSPPQAERANRRHQAYHVLPESEPDVEDLSEEDVLLADDSARYYNLSASSQANRRRHSISTFMNSDRERTVSFNSVGSFHDDFPIAIVHSSADGEIAKSTGDTHVYQPNGRCNRCTTKGSRSRSEMDDIVIVSSRHSQAAGLWVSYFRSCFEQISKQTAKQTFKVSHIGIEDVTSTGGITTLVEERLAAVKLQVVIICPAFLEHALEQPLPTGALCRLLKPDRVIAMLLGVTDQDLHEVHYDAFPSYKLWQRLPVGQDQDETFACTFLQRAMNIFTRVEKQRQLQSKEKKSAISVMPKKVKQGQTCVIVLLASPLDKEDVIDVTIDKNGEMLEVKPLFRRNPYTLKFTMPDSCLEVSVIVNVLVHKNGKLLGSKPVKCESRVRELDQLLRSIAHPVEFICQTLGLPRTDSEQLDNWLTINFRKNLPPNFHLLSSPKNHFLPTNKIQNGHEEYPTLLHFAARFGLEKLTWQLLECHGSDVANDLRNVCELTPAEMAEINGHDKVAKILREYTEMDNFTSMFNQIKEMTENKTKDAENGLDEEDYLAPKPFQQNYVIPPAARPVTPPNTQVLAELIMARCMEMENSEKSTSSYQGPSKNDSPPQTPATSPVSPYPQQQSHQHTLQEQIQQQMAPEPTHQQQHQQQQQQHHQPHHQETVPKPISKNLNKYEDKVQGELIEIISDFKNNVFTLSEVEALVDNWKNRNDVQKSYIDKQMQLNEMRKEYDRIQEKMKEEMKRLTPFDKIKKLFAIGGKGKGAADQTKSSNCGEQEKNGLDCTQNPLGHRPVSSASTSSSSSFGRMSSISGCSVTSLGDSGTHSDHEERKHLMRQANNDHEYFEINEQCKNLFLNYCIPPPPKPVHKYSPKLTTFKSHQFTTIEERPQQNANFEMENGDKYYIQFPACGLPIEMVPKTTEERKSEMEPIPKNDYMNMLLSPDQDCRNQEGAGSLPSYMNYKPIPNEISLPLTQKNSSSI